MKLVRYLNFSAHLVLCLGLAACSGHLRVTASPDKAKLTAVTRDGKSIDLGETPLVLTPNELMERKLSLPITLRVEREGFAPQDLLITSLEGVNVDYLVDLKPFPLVQKTNEMVNQLFKAQSLAQSAKYAESLKILEELYTQFPQVAAISEMQGSIHMLRGNYEVAVEHFSRALNLDPSNLELKALHDSAVSAVGGRRPAQGGGQ